MASIKRIKQLIERLGNEEIVRIQCTRNVIDSKIKWLLDNIATSDIIYDQIFHLQMYVYTRRGVFSIEKNSTVQVIYNAQGNRPDQKIDIYNLYDLIKRGGKLTVYELINNALNKYGNARFFNYDAFNNNCQDFVMMLLDSSGLLASYDVQWIKQDADQILASLPNGSNNLANLLTNIHALLSGSGVH